MKGFPAHATASRTIASQVGDLVLLASEKGLAGLFFGHRTGENVLPPDDGENEHLSAAEEQLREFFAGERKRFEVALDVCGTEFQKSVWAELSRIPFGVTRSYRDIAEGIGNPKVCGRWGWQTARIRSR
jgi:methylated-DNA-[protein]-cysteine S-methyltransferase